MARPAANPDDRLTPIGVPFSPRDLRAIDREVKKRYSNRGETVREIVREYFDRVANETTEFLTRD